MTISTTTVALAAVIQHSFLTAERTLLEAIAFAQEQGEHEAAARLQSVLKLTRAAHRRAEEIVPDIEGVVGGPVLRSGGDDKPPPPPED
jgi:hypothetical protein